MWKEASSNMFRRKGAPALQGSPHMCARTFLMKSCVDCKLTDLHGNFRQYILVRPACIFYFLIVDKSWTELGHLAFRFDPVGRPHTFFPEQCPAFVNQAPEKKRFENGNRLLYWRDRLTFASVRLRVSTLPDVALAAVGADRVYAPAGETQAGNCTALVHVCDKCVRFQKHFGNISETFQKDAHRFDNN